MNNWANNIHFSPLRVVPAMTVGDVVNAVQEAERHYQGLRAVGSRWSFTDIIHTNDVLVDVSRLNKVLGAVRGPDNLLPGSPMLERGLRNEIRDSAVALVHVEAGITIKDLYTQLDRMGLALVSQGGSAGQSLAGAISTGTHGAEPTPPLSDFVRAIHLIGPGGVHYWIEPGDERRITDWTNMIGVTPWLGVDNIHYGDEWFYACVVAMGCMGVIVDLVIEVTRQYGVSQRVAQRDWTAVRRMFSSKTSAETKASLFGSLLTPPRTTASGLPAITRLDGFEVFLNPYRRDDYGSNSDDSRNCVVSAKFRTVEGAGFDESISPPGASGGLPPLAVNALEAGTVGFVRQQVDNIIGSVRKDILSYPKAFSVKDTYSGPVPYILSMELVVPTAGDKHLELLDRMLQVFDELILRRNGIKFIGGLNFRFTQPSRALLGMQNNSFSGGATEEICHIEVHAFKEAWEVWPFDPNVDNSGNMEGETDQFVMAFENAAHALGARVHWGMLNQLTRARVEASYPGTLHRWRKVRTELCSFGRRATFSNWFSRRCGLETYSEVLASAADSARYHVFGINERGDVLQLFGDGNWNSANLGSHFARHKFSGPLTAASWGADRLDIFGLGGRGMGSRAQTLLHLWWDGNKWHWDAMENGFTDREFTGPLTATSRGQNRYDIFGLDADGNLLQVWFDGLGQGWHWDNLGNLAGGDRFFGGLSATSWGADRIDIFGLGRLGNVLHAWWDGNSWQCENLGLQFPNGDRFVGPLSAVSPTRGQIDVFGVGIRGNVLRIFWSGSHWSWTDLENKFTSQVPKRYGPNYSFGIGGDAPYRNLERAIERDRFVGPVTAAAGGGLIRVFGFGESGKLLILQFDPAAPTVPVLWRDLENPWGP